MHRIEDALTLGPRSVRVAVHALARRARRTCSSPSALMTEITSEMFATSPREPFLRRAHRVLRFDPVGDVARVRDDAEHRRVVAVIGRDHLDPAHLAVGAPEPVADRLRRARIAAQALEHRRDAPADPRRTDRSRRPGRDRSSDRCRGTSTRSGCDTSPRPSGAMIVTMSLEFCTSERNRTSLSRKRELGALLVADVGEHEDRGHDATGRVAQRRDRDVHVDRAAVLAGDSAPARARTVSPANTGAVSSLNAVRGLGERRERADRLRRGPPEQLFRRAIPHVHGARGIDREDRAAATTERSIAARSRCGAGPRRWRGAR